ncbi:patatin-like phospholipase family protein [Gluconacetobacter entanii]|uniref:patatin-like phospholipase family protein n=1 Tax=Gluconacetobacter entanii TaxID=108528 RepID=UPI00142D7CE6|nr:patatin-like phospholipase family protein [Gluconacetobacter entanii]
MFVALAGGGAKGLLHVGALRALEDRDVVFCGLAGTSAGAIVAALKAAGFSSRDLLDPDGGPTLIDQLNEIDPNFNRATDIFGRTGWARVLLFRWASAHSWVVKTLALMLTIAIPPALIVAGATRSAPVIVSAALAIVGLAVLGFLLWLPSVMQEFSDPY